MILPDKLILSYMINRSSSSDYILWSFPFNKTVFSGTTLTVYFCEHCLPVTEIFFMEDGSAENTTSGRHALFGLFLWLHGSHVVHTNLVTIFNYYRPQTKLWEGYVFTGVCDSVNRGGGYPIMPCTTTI